MLLAAPAGLHFNALLSCLLDLQLPENFGRYKVVLLIDVALAVLAIPAAALLRHAPPNPPCASAEQPYPPHAHAPGVVSPSSSQVGQQQLPAYSPNAVHSAPLSQHEHVRQRGAEGQGSERCGILEDVPRLLRSRSFLVLLLAFSLTIGAFNTYYLNMEESLDVYPLGVHLGKTIASFGAVAFTAGASGSGVAQLAQLQASATRAIPDWGVWPSDQLWR